MIDSLPPWRGAVRGGAAAALVPGAALARSVVLLLAPLAALALIWTLPDGQVLAFEYLGMTLVPLRVDALARLFATIFAIMAFAGCLFSLNQRSTAELAAACVYAGSAIGVALAGDLITLLVFWELMALASTAIIWSAGTPASFRAAGRYLMIHLLGGMILTVGIVAHVVRDRLGRLQHHARRHRQPADPGRLPDQRRRLADLGLASRRLPRGLVERHGVPLRLHHQGRRLRPAPRLPRRRDPRSRRPGHDLLRDHLRAARKRHAPDPRLQHRQPGRVHGHRHRHRHRDGAERRRRACLRPHHLQGAAADVGGLGAVS